MMQWEGVATPAQKTPVSGFHTVIGPQMFIGVQIDPLGLKNQGPENRIKFVIPINRFYSGNGRGFVFGVFLAFPQSNLFVGFLQKQNFPVLFFFGIRADDQRTLLLIDTAQIEQVGLLNKSVGAVCTGGHHVIGIEHSDGIRLQLFNESPAVLNEQVGVNR
jgi:hypothetical protein